MLTVNRLNCESDTTPNTTPEERRRRAQSEVKTAALTNKQQNYHRSRTSNIGTHNKELPKKSETTKYRTPSVSRTDTGRFSMRATKPTHVSINFSRVILGFFFQFKIFLNIKKIFRTFFSILQVVKK